MILIRIVVRIVAIAIHFNALPHEPCIMSLLLLMPSLEHTTCVCVMYSLSNDSQCVGMFKKN